LEGVEHPELVGGGAKGVDERRVCEGAAPAPAAAAAGRRGGGGRRHGRRHVCVDG